MCGIFLFIGNGKIDSSRKKVLENGFQKIRHRGPDCSKVRYYDSNVMMGFHRLAVIDPTDSGMQPFETSEYSCIVNGEIYNYKHLIQKHSLSVQTHSDCEVVAHLIRKLNLDDLFQELDGEYAFIYYDIKNKRVLFAVDQIRARPLFLGEDRYGIYLASEQKALKCCNKIIPVPSGCYGIIENHSYEITSHYNWDVPIVSPSIEPHLILRDLFIKNVSAKLNPERPYCFLLSGGLDSSLVCGVAAKLCAPTRIHTFTVGFDKNASDVVKARTVAKHIDSIHEEFIFTYEDGIAILKDVIYANESWDQTSTRASVAMSLACRKIKQKHPDMVVVFSGELSDELLMGYLEWKSSPNPTESRKHSIKRVRDVTYFDGLRADRTISSCSMELRLPFFSKELLDFVFSLSPEFLDPNCNNGVEKYLLRKAFEGLNYIPEEILFRSKAAFSDGGSIVGKNSWKEHLKAYAEKEITDSRFGCAKQLFPYQTPQTKEDMLYREIFEGFEYTAECIPYPWLPAWNEGMTDSSATELPGFKETSYKLNN